MNARQLRDLRDRKDKVGGYGIGERANLTQAIHEAESTERRLGRSTFNRSAKSVGKPIANGIVGATSHFTNRVRQITGSGGIGKKTTRGIGHLRARRG